MTARQRPARYVHRRPGRQLRLRRAEDGSHGQGERVAKYNRLMEIAAAHPGLPYGIPAP